VIRRLPTDPAQLYLKPVDQDRQQTLPLDQPFLQLNLNKLVMVDTQLISSRAMEFMVARLAANMLVLEELEATKQPDKVTKAANTEVIKLSEATTMAIASNVADGVATTDISPAKVATRLGRLWSPRKLLTKCVTTILNRLSRISMERKVVENPMAIMFPFYRETTKAACNFPHRSSLKTTVLK
jgi:hypothetical protein